MNWYCVCVPYLDVSENELVALRRYNKWTELAKKVQGGNK